MTRKSHAPHPRSLLARGLSAALVLVVAAAAFIFALGRPDSASAHCDSVDGPVVTAARGALLAGDVRLILPYVKPDAEAELTAAFNQTMAVRALGGDAQVMADRYFFETAVRLHRVGEGASYTGLKTTAEADPALEAADAALAGDSLKGVYRVLGDLVQVGVQEHYQAVLDAREREAREGTVEAARERVEAELLFEKYVYGIAQAASGAAGHSEGATPAHTP